jgi:radical SAM superfamily enzyme YgiQ (UPF0313 family)
MRLLLVDNLIMPEGGSLAELDVHPHLGLLALAAVAEPEGHTVRIYDPKRLIRERRLTLDATLYQRVSEELLEWRPDAVGFTALGCSFLFALNVAAALKRRAAELPVLLGGPHATMLHQEILGRFPQFDLIVRHEADETFPRVLEALERREFAHIPGLSWRTRPGGAELRCTHGKPKVEDLDQLPLASYDHYPIATLGLDLLRIEAGRGCPFQCTFCSTAGFFQRSFRLKSAARLVLELDLLHHYYGVGEFKLDHDLFTVNRRKVLEFCAAVAGRGYHWRASARVDCVDVALLETMATAGCVGLYFGVETGSARLQRICQKRLDLALVGPVLERCAALGIETTASFITGYPQEEIADQNDTLDLLGRCVSRSCLTQLHLLAPEPGTPLFAQFGAGIQYDGHGGRYNSELLSADDERAVRAHPDIFQTYYYYPSVLPRARARFAVETVDLLRRTGATVFQYLLRAYAGRLSRLVEAFQIFAAGQRREDCPDAPLLEAYISAAFGREHHLTSLIRYALNAAGASAKPAMPRAQRRFDPKLRYRLNGTLRLLADMHDCEYVLRRIEADAGGGALLEASQVGDLGCYLIVGEGSGSTHYYLDSGSQAIMSLFQVPSRARDVARQVRSATGCEVPSAFFNELAASRIIVPEVTRA